jgi:cell wall-associated NlpC family hydrolase
MTTTTTQLNLRGGWSTNYPVLLTIPKGASVTVTGAAHDDWYPVAYSGKTGWVSGKYLSGIAELPVSPATGKASARAALLSYLHISYIWGGQSRSGLDCSGLVGVWWVEIGFREKGFDTTADKLFDGYRSGALPGRKLDNPEFGALAFYGSGTNAGHVAVCYDDVTVIGANGGSKSMDTPAKARVKGACVRLDKVDYRKDLLGIWMPSYGW